MICIKDGRVQIQGDPDELFDELIKLYVTIVQDDGLMLVNEAAMKRAIKVIKDKDYSIQDINAFKVGGVDKKDEFKEKWGG